jgi:hypothetical protein
LGGAIVWFIIIIIIIIIIRTESRPRKQKGHRALTDF